MNQIMKWKIFNNYYSEKSIREYVFFKLGHPVRAIELDDEQFKALFTEAKSIVDFENIDHFWVKELTYALCLECLGLIRSKFHSIPIPNGDVTLNGELLIKLGREIQQYVLLKKRPFITTV